MAHVRVYAWVYEGGPWSYSQRMSKLHGGFSSRGLLLLSRTPAYLSAIATPSRISRNLLQLLISLSEGRRKRRTCRRDSGSPQGQPGRSESIDPPSLTEIKLPGRYISVRRVIHLTVALCSVDSSVSTDMRSLIFAAVSWFCKSSA